MSPLQNWLSKPRATVRIDTTMSWAAWMKMLRQPFSRSRPDMRPRIEVLDRLALGGKKSLLLIAIEERRLLIGVGEGAAPSLLDIEGRLATPFKQPVRRGRAGLRARRSVR